MTAAALPRFVLLRTAGPARLRYRVPELTRNAAFARSLERALCRFACVHQVRASELTGTLLVTLSQPGAEPAASRALAAVLDGRSPRADEDPGAPDRTHRRPTTASQPGARLSPPMPQGCATPSRRTQQPAPRKGRGESWLVPGAARRPPAPRPGPTATTSDAAAPRFHSLPLQRVLAQVRAAETGLSAADAQARLSQHGPNTIAPAPRRGQLRILLDQLASTPVAMLGVSAVMSAATGGVSDAAAILGVLGINATIGYVTESGAERTIASLTKSTQDQVQVLRDGRPAAVPLAAVVLGDVLLLEAGIFVAADARLLVAQDLTLDESSLTGESVPVLKSAAEESEPGAPLTERSNMIYRGTLVTGGSGRAVVVATGARTEVGQVQALAGSVADRATPMQQQLDRLGTQLALGAGLACVATLGAGLLRGQALLPMFRTAVSLGVAAVPEGLPTVAIATLALGLSRMRRERVIVRQLAAVETLGAVQVVCLDKTGTVTLNRMSVVALQAGLQTYAVRDGRLLRDDGAEVSGLSPELHQLLRMAVLCNEVEIHHEQGREVLRGSPTESALIQCAMDAGLDVDAERRRHPVLSMQRRAEHRNYMSSEHGGAGGQLLAVKGRPSEVLALCSHFLRDGRPQPLDSAERALIENDNERMAGRALRVLGVAYAQLSQDAPRPQDGDLPPLVWLGLIGMEDPPRSGVAEVLAQFHQACIRTIMITGDQSATAQAVGKRIGLSENAHLEIIDSTRLDRIEPSLLAPLAQRADVFARVSPAHKLQIVQALQRSGCVVAMTGDGINDGPALKAADIGIAMGAGGALVAREVADVVLEDDQLQTLVLAIEQGRTIYEDIRKAVHFILATNLSEILYTFSCVAGGLGEPLTPMQLLWINLLTDIFPELALAVQPPEWDVLARPPRDPQRPMFTTPDLQRIGGEGAVITAGALAAYLWATRRNGPGRRASTVGFTALTLAQLLHAISARSERHTIFDRGHLARNPWLFRALSGTLLLQLAAGVAPGLRRLLGTVPLVSREWAVALVAAGLPFLVNEAVKLVLRDSAPEPEAAAPLLTAAE